MDEGGRPICVLRKLHSAQCTLDRDPSKCELQVLFLSVFCKIYSLRRRKQSTSDAGIYCSTHYTTNWHRSGHKYSSKFISLSYICFWFGLTQARLHDTVCAILNNVQVRQAPPCTLCVWGGGRMHVHRIKNWRADGPYTVY